MPDNKITIGVDRLAYPQKLNYTDLPFKKYRFTSHFNLLRTIIKSKYLLSGNIDTTYLYAFYDFPLSRSRMYHFFNAVPLAKVPFITTFETLVPYWPWEKHPVLTKRGIELINSEYCQKLISISQSGYTIFKESLIENGINEDTILSKTIIVKPSVPVNNINLETKYLNSEQITFIFVGHLFTIKGGIAILMAFDELFKRNINVKLIIVSKLIGLDNKKKWNGIYDKDTILTFFRKYSDRVDYYPELSNNELLKLMGAAHVGLFPSPGDTYGYVGLEMMANGCPVITTDVRAQGEYNNNDRGWVIELGNENQSIRENRKNIEVLNVMISNFLIKTIENILNENPSILLLNKAKKAIKYIRKEHSPQRNAEIIESIYDNALLRGE